MKNGTDKRGRRVSGKVDKDQWKNRFALASPRTRNRGPGTRDLDFEGSHPENRQIPKITVSPVPYLHPYRPVAVIAPDPCKRRAIGI
jgi:hypothetical protein